jgi:hypothetical protein
MPSDSERELLTVEGREVTISNPRKVLFPQAVQFLALVGLPAVFENHACGAAVWIGEGAFC